MSTNPLLDLYKLDGIEVAPKYLLRKWWKLPVKMWWVSVVVFFFWVIGIFRPGQKEDFYENYITTLWNWVFFPDESYSKLMTGERSYKSTLRHERVHVLDSRRHWYPRFALRYVLCKKWRAYYERRGYVQNMIVEFERTGDVSDRTVAWITDIFKGDMYWKMDVEAQPKIEAMRERVISGEYQGHYPNVY